MGIALHITYNALQDCIEAEYNMFLAALIGL